MIKSPVFLAIILLVATLVAVGYQAYELNKIRLGKTNVVNKSDQIKQEKPAATSEQIPTLAQLAKENLMGNPYRPAPKAVVQTSISATTLKLILVGTINKTNGGQGSALIQGSNRETKRYFVGEMIEPGVSLDAVAVDSVMLKRNGQLERLGYPESTTSGLPAMASGSPAIIPVPSNSPAAPAQRPVINQPQGNNTAAGVGANKKIMSLRERLKQNSKMQQAPTTGTDNSQGAK